MQKLVFITSRFPNPPVKGDQLRAYNQLLVLSNSYNITLVSFSEKQIGKKDTAIFEKAGIEVENIVIPKTIRYFNTAKAIFSKVPLQVAYFNHKSARRKVTDKITATNPDIVHAHLIRTAAYLHDNGTALNSLDFMDAFSLGLKKRVEHSKKPFTKWLLKIETKRLVNYQRALLHQVANCHAISQQDADAISPKGGRKINIVSNGVDFDQFYPKWTKKEYDIVFMGNMDYPPNITAVLYLINKITPRLSASFPNLKVLIAGRNAPKVITGLADKRIDVILNFEDISDAIAKSRIMVAPMFMSIGLQNKILQAMAMKVPCVTTTAANNAIGATPGKTIELAENAEEFVEKIERLLTKPTHYKSVADNAHSFVNANFKWEKLTKKLFNDENKE